MRTYLLIFLSFCVVNVALASDSDETAENKSISDLKAGEIRSLIQSLLSQKKVNERELETKSVDINVSPIFQWMNSLAYSSMEIGVKDSNIQNVIGELWFIDYMGDISYESVQNTLKGHLSAPGMVRLDEITERISELVDDFLKTLDYDETDETRDFVNDPFLSGSTPEASDWSSRVLSDSASGLEAMLTDLNDMITDNNGKPSIFKSYASVLKQQVSDKDFPSRMQAFAYYLSSRQILGYMMRIQGLRMTDGDVEIPKNLFNQRKIGQMQYFNRL